MAKLQWATAGQKIYETGVKQGVLYPQSVDGTYPKGVAWNGLISVSESPSGAEPTPIYADDTKYLTLMSTEEFGGTIEAYTYPDDFAECDGTATLGEAASGVTIGQQTRKGFGLAYRTSIGNDTQGIDHGYKLHLVYGCLASPSEKTYQSINESPEAITFSWEFTTTPVAVTGKKPTSTLVIDSTKVDSGKLAKIEEKLFGGSATEPSLLLPDEILAILTAPLALAETEEQ